MSQDFSDRLDFDKSTTGVPDEITTFADKEAGDDWEQEFAELLNFLSNFFQQRMVYDGKGNPAAVIPKYQSSEMQDNDGNVDANEWAERMKSRDGEADPAIIKDGTFVRVK